MSSEVCPFCGRTYKRLKSHLPHCKAAANPQTPPTRHHVAPTQTTSSSQSVAGLSEATAKGKESKQPLPTAASPQSKKSRKMSAVQPAAAQSTSPPALSTKKKKPSDGVKTASSSAAPSLTSSPVPSPCPSSSKNKSLRAPIEASKSDQVSKGSLGINSSASEDLPSGSYPFRTDPLRSRSKSQAATNIVVDSATALSTDTKPKDVPQKKVSKPKKAAQTLSKPESQSNARLRVKDLWRDSAEGGRQAGITVQDVKAALRRAKPTTQPSSVSFLSQAEHSDTGILNTGTRSVTGPSPATAAAGSQKDAVSRMVSTEPQSDRLPRLTSQRTDPQSVKKKSSKSLIPLQHDGSSQPELTFPASPLLSGHPSFRVSQSSPLSPTVSAAEGLKAGRPRTGLLSLSPSPIQLPIPRPFPPAPQTPPARAEAARADDVLKLESRKQRHARSEDPLAQRSLGQVRLRELPEWLACKTPSHPRDAVEMVQRGWQWYYRRYIDVRKGGVGGLGMVLAGYCVLSYIWRYPQIKRERWRKYH